MQRVDSWTNAIFQPKEKIDIHQSKLKKVSKTALKNLRLFAFISMSIVLLLLHKTTDSLFKQIMFLSDQGFLITWLYFALSVQDYFWNDPKLQALNVCPRLKYVVQLMFQLSICLQVPITVVYWLVLFEDDIKDATSEYIMAQILIHSAPIIFLLMDETSNGYRFLRNRLYAIVLYAIVYMLLNLVYSVKVYPVYDIINWKSFMSYVYVAAVAFMIIGTHFFGRMLYQKYKRQEDQERQELVDLKLKQMKSNRCMNNGADKQVEQKQPN